MPDLNNVIFNLSKYPRNTFPRIIQMGSLIYSFTNNQLVEISGISMKLIQYLLFMLFFSCSVVAAKPALSAESLRLKNILEAEFMLQKGDTLAAFNRYHQLLQTTDDPSIAKRAMEIALLFHQLDKADQIEFYWLNKHPSQKDILATPSWHKALFKGEYSYVFSHLTEALQKSQSLTEREYIFGCLIEILIKNRNLSRYTAQVHTATNYYSENFFANLADILYSALAQKTKWVEEGLVHLHQHNPQLNDKTLLAIHFLYQLSPHYMDHFFKYLPAQDYHEEWLPIYVAQFMEKKDYDSVLSILNKAIQKKPSVSLYLDAANIFARKGALYQQQQYLKKAYDLAATSTKEAIALAASHDAITHQEWTYALNWANRVKSYSMTFDRLIILGYQALANQQINTLDNLIAQVETLPKLDGVLFTIDAYVTLQLNHIFFSLKEDQLQQALVITEQLERTLNKNINLIEPRRVQTMIFLIKATIYQQLENYPKAIKYFQKAYALNTSAEIADSLGQLYLFNHRAKLALPYFTQAFRKKPSTKIAAHLIEALWLNNYRHDALQLIDQYLQKDPNNPLILQTIRRLNIKMDK